MFVFLRFGLKIYGDYTFDLKRLFVIIRTLGKKGGVI